MLQLSQTTKSLIGYTLVSIALLAFAIENARNMSNNYFTFLYQLTDGLNLGILLNTFCCVFVVVAKCCQVVMFGELRLIEQEHIIEKLPIFLINLLLNLTTRGNNLILNILLISVSVLSKVLHSILIDRLDFTHISLVNQLSDLGPYDYKNVLQLYGRNSYVYWNFIFFCVDFLIAKFLVYDVFQGINSITCLLFGFQFAELGLETLTYFLKNCLNIYELAAYPNYDIDDDEFDLDNVPDVDTQEERENHQDSMGVADGDDDDDDEREKVWENKGIYIKSIEISCSAFKMVAYVSFIYLLSYHTGIAVPFSMLQGLYLSVRKTYQQVKLLLAFLESSKRLDSQLQDASAEDLSRNDNLCIICRDTMSSVVDYETSRQKKMPPRKKPKKLACGHILHIGCLKDWLERSESCPLCRRKVFENLTQQSSPQPSPAPQETQAQPQPPPQPQAQAAVDPNEAPRTEAPPAARRFQEFNNIIRQRRQYLETRTSQESSDTSTRNDDTETQEVENITAQPVDTATSSAAEPQPTPTPTFSSLQAHSRTRDGFQHIALPSNSILPPNWTILPAHRTNIEGVDYHVKLSESTTVNMAIKQKRTGGELNLIDPNFNSSDLTNTSTTANDNTNEDTNGL